MFNLLIILLTTVVLLIAVQIIALLRIRHLANQLKQAIWLLKPSAAEQSQKIRNSSQTITKTCEFCKYRKTYLSEHPQSSADSIYYRCNITDKNIQLNYSCTRFQPEFSLLDQSGQIG